MVHDINPAGGSDPRDLAVAGGWLYFHANDGIHGRELWRTDGTPGGALLVADLRTGTAINPPPQGLTELNGRIVFSAPYSFNGTSCGPELFISDGTPEGTERLNEAPGCTASNPTSIVRAGNVVYFVASRSVAGTSTGRELWKSDGTAAGTVLVKDINPGVLSSDPFFLTPVGGGVYFTAEEPSTGRELWHSDGTRAGTRMVADLLPGSVGSNPHELTVSGNKLFFVYGQGGGPFVIGSLLALPLNGGATPEPPAISPAVNGSLGANGWFVSDVSISWTIDDKGSPITGTRRIHELPDPERYDLRCALRHPGG